MWALTTVQTNDTVLCSSEVQHWLSSSRSVVLKPPYPLERRPADLHYTYLDTMGRPVVVASKQNVVEQHIQDFEVRGSGAKE